MNKLSFYSILVLIFSFSIFSCSHDHDHDHETMTTVELKLVGDGETITLTSRDLDGDGPNAPVVTVVGEIKKDVNYIGSIRFLNELENPAEDLTPEIVSQGTAHQVFYLVSNGLGSFTYTDVDTNGRPIGVTTSFVSNTTDSGNLRIVLRHNLNKNASGVAEGNIANAGGETDIEVNFNITVVE